MGRGREGGKIRVRETELRKVKPLLWSSLAYNFTHLWGPDSTMLFRVKHSGRTCRSVLVSRPL